MPLPTIRPAADPLDTIDHVRTVDGAMEREDRADIPGQRSDDASRGDVYVDAARELSRGSPTTDDSVLDDHDGSRVPASGERDLLGDAIDGLRPMDAAHGADDDDPIDETERAGDDSLP